VFSLLKMATGASRNCHKRNVESWKFTYFLPLFFFFFAQRTSKIHATFCILDTRPVIYKSKRQSDPVCTGQQHMAAGLGTADQISEPTLLLEQHWQQIKQHNRATSRALWTCRSVPCEVRVSGNKGGSRSVLVGNYPDWGFTVIFLSCNANAGV
jgi:hypothetical protein